jgi:RNA 3'-terminal phosphate cyclase (ATP)
MIEIDGGMGEGGGQIIRTALSLSALLGTPFLIDNIRKNRPKPGLRAQHLVAVRAVKTISKARVEGDQIGSTRLFFEPRKVEPGTYRFDIGTAGATPLVLQALLPPLLFTDVPSHLSLTGGTHVPISPPLNFVQEVFVPFLFEMGFEVRVSLGVYGFYPRGGGHIAAAIKPLGRVPLESIDLPQTKSIWMVRGVSAVGNLPLSIAERQKNAALETLKAIAAPVEIETVSVAPSPGTGTFFFLQALGGQCRGGFSSIGIRGKRAETVGMEAASALLEYYRKPGCVDPNLADQIVLYMALAHGTSSFTTTEVTPHLLTNLSIIEMFTRSRSRIEGEAGAPGRVTIEGIAFHGPRSAD